MKLRRRLRAGLLPKLFDVEIGNMPGEHSARDGWQDDGPPNQSHLPLPPVPAVNLRRTGEPDGPRIIFNTAAADID